MKSLRLALAVAACAVAILTGCGAHGSAAAAPTYAADPKTGYADITVCHSLLESDDLPSGFPTELKPAPCTTPGWGGVTDGTNDTYNTVSEELRVMPSEQAAHAAFGPFADERKMIWPSMTEQTSSTFAHFGTDVRYFAEVTQLLTHRVLLLRRGNLLIALDVLAQQEFTESDLDQLAGKALDRAAQPN